MPTDVINQLRSYLDYVSAETGGETLAPSPARPIAPWYRRGPALGVVAAVLVLAVGVPALILRSNQPPPAVAQLPEPLDVGVERVWPDSGFQGDPNDIAAAFAEQALGWSDVETISDPEASPDGPVWTTIRSDGYQDLEVLSVPIGGGLRVLMQVGSPGLTVGPADDGSGQRIGLSRVAGSESAVLHIRYVDPDRVEVVSATAADLENGELEVDSGSPIGGIVAVYLDADGESITAVGGHFGPFDPSLIPNEEPGSLAEYLNEISGGGPGLLPESRIEGARSVIDLTFTDGRRVEFVYPSEWALDRYGWTPDTDIAYELDGPRVVHGQLVFELGPDGAWTTSINLMSEWTNEEITAAESLLTLTTEPNGFVTVRTMRPLSHNSHDPDQAPLNSDYRGEARIYVGDILGLSSTETCVEDPEYPYPQRDASSVTWCDQDAGVTVGFLLPEEYHDEILDNVDIRLISTDPTLPTTFPATRTDAGLGWEAVEIPTDLVARCHRALVSTETELIFWGGNQPDCEYESPVGNPAMAYNPDTGMWRQLAESPMEPVVAPTGVWTGTEVIFCCGMTSRQAAAYDPATDTWRTLAESPLGGPFPEARWTGEEMVVITQTGAAAYNPATDSWREFPPMPEDFGRTNEIEWTGSELVVWPRFPVGDPLRRVEEGMALNPTTDTWRVLPDPEPWPSWVDMVVTDDSIVIWGGLPANQLGSERAVGAQFDLDLGTWRPVPEALPEPDGCECNLGSQTLTWTGEYVLVSPGHFSTGVNPTNPVLIAYHPVTNSWILVDEDSPLAWGGDSLTVGDRLAIVANDVFYTSPPDWQPTGEPITQDSWSD